MNSKSTMTRWAMPALLPTALAVFWLLPVAAEAPVEAYGDDPVASETLGAYAASNDAIVVDSEVYVADDNITVVALETPADYGDSIEATLEEDAGYDDAAVEVVILGQDELSGLIGPIALYPDDLLAIVLPASTYPLEIVQAARFLDDLEKNPSLKPSEDWDESVTALLNYPEVVHMMNDDIDWTWKLGGAVLNQQQDVIAAVESFRDRAYAAGNLQSDDYQTVSNDGDSIAISRTNEEVIYVPYYEPERVVIRQVEPVYYYYPRPYPVYYYPYPRDHYFSSGFFWGVTSAFRIGWSSHHLHVHHHSFWGHPYYGHTYNSHYYRRPSVTIHNNYYYVNNSGRRSPYRYRDGDYWRPRPASGVRPGGHGVRRPVHRNNNGRDDAARDRNSALMASQTTRNRPGNRADRNVHRPTGRDLADHTRSRPRDSKFDSATRDNGSNRHRAVPGQRDRARPEHEYGDTIRFRERPAPVTAATRPAIRPATRPNTDSAASANARPQSAGTARPRPLRVDDRDRQRPGQRGDRTTTRQNNDTIRFRERPRPVTAASRPAAQNPNVASTTARPQASPSAARRPARDRAATRSSNQRRAVRDTVQRSTERPRVVSQRRATPKPATPTRTQTTQRETSRRAAAPASNAGQRARANRDTQVRSKPKAAAKEQKSSSKKQQSGRTDRQTKRRK